jgi:hypothetical protein
MVRRSHACHYFNGNAQGWPSGLCAAHQVCLLFTSLTCLLKISTPSHASRRRAAIYPSHSAFAAAVISCTRPHCGVRFSFLPIASAHQRLSLLAPAVPTYRAPTRAARSRIVGRAAPPLLVLVVPLRASGRSSGEPSAPMSVGHAGGARTLRPKSIEPASTSSLICCKCMFQVF